MAMAMRGLLAAVAVAAVCGGADAAGDAPPDVDAAQLFVGAGPEAAADGGNVTLLVNFRRQGREPGTPLRSRAALAAFVERLAAAGGDLSDRMDEVLAAAVAVRPAVRDAVVAALLASPLVDFVEADTVFNASTSGVQSNPPWHLDRSDQRGASLDGRYVYDTNGEGVDVYVLDTGSRLTHEEFTGRATQGYSEFADPSDGNGHGTHVASSAMGTRFGVAKGAQLHAVKVLSDSGAGSTSGIIRGINWVIAQHRSSGRPSVINMSLGGSASRSLDRAVEDAIAAGVTVVVAAGNENQDACNVSPSRVPGAISVGAVRQSGVSGTVYTVASFSNYGPCVDVFAPGVEIAGAWFESDTQTRTIQGTSMASPQVAGMVALLLEAHPSLSPAETLAAVRCAATTGVLLTSDTGAPDNALLTYSRVTSFFEAAGQDGPEQCLNGTSPCRNATGTLAPAEWTAAPLNESFTVEAGTAGYLRAWVTAERAADGGLLGGGDDDSGGPTSVRLALWRKDGDDWTQVDETTHDTLASVSVAVNATADTEYAWTVQNLDTRDLVFSFSSKDADAPVVPGTFVCNVASSNGLTTLEVFFIVIASLFGAFVLFLVCKCAWAAYSTPPSADGKRAKNVGADVEYHGEY